LYASNCVREWAGEQDVYFSGSERDGAISCGTHDRHQAEPKIAPTARLAESALRKIA